MSTKTVVQQRFPRISRSIEAINSGWDQIGEQTRFFGITLRSLVDVVVYYRAELLRQIAAMSLGTGSLAIVGGSVAVIAFLTMSTGGTIASEGYNQFSNIGVEAMTGFGTAFANTRLVTPFTAAIAFAATIDAPAPPPSSARCASAKRSTHWK